MSEWISGLIDSAGYLGVAFLMFAETVFPPIPSEVIMPLAGLSAARGQMSIAGVIVSGTAGAMLGNTFWYLLARALGLERLHPFIDRWGRWLTMDWREVQRADRWFQSRGAAFVFFGRLLPTVRSLVSVPAGLLHMSFSRFVFWSTLGTAGWTSLLALAGWQLGRRYGEIEQYVGPLSITIIILIVLWYVIRVVRWRAEH